MQTFDPFTSFVTTCVLPAATATCMVWSFYLLAIGSPPPWVGGYTASPLAKGSTPIRLPVAAR